jgi:hypothetical protein
MLINPTSVPAVIIHALLPVSSQFGTEGDGKLLRLAGGVYGAGACACANAECALSKIIKANRTTTGTSVFLLRRNLVTFIGKLSVSECASFTSPGLH